MMFGGQSATQRHEVDRQRLIRHPGLEVACS
jgi:hypothetical protein